MVVTKPKFSLLIPTRNRAHMLKHAIDSALSQTYADIEIVISNNNSTDQTQALIEKIDDPRVRCIQTQETLAAPYHWEWALKHVRGEYVTLLCDDDALVPQACSRIAKALNQTQAQMILWHRIAYIYSEWKQCTEVSNSVRVRKYSGQLQEKKTAENLHQWFESCDYLKHSPLGFNCFCKTSLIEDIHNRHGVFFMPPAPDVGASLWMLKNLDSYYYIDSPISLAGVSPVSIGATYSTTSGEAVERFEKEFKKPVYEYSPCKIPGQVNIVVETLLWAQKQYPEIFAQYTLNWTNYWAGCLFDMQRYKLNGVDVSEQIKTLNSQISNLDPCMQSKIKEIVKSRISGIKRHERKTKLRRRLFGSIGSKSKVITGNKVGFNNIYECACKLDQITGFVDK